jgi:hypothetical protein
MTLTAARAAKWLATNVSAIAADESAGLYFGEIQNAIISIENAINRPIPDRFLGPCPALLSDTNGERICSTDLTAPRVDDHVQCRSCKTTHRVGELIDQRMLDAYAMSFTLSELFRTILPINREYVPLRTLQQWVARGRLVPTGYDSDGEPRFLLADVRKERDKKPQGKPTGAAAHLKNKRAS